MVKFKVERSDTYPLHRKACPSSVSLNVFLGKMSIQIRYPFFSHFFFPIELYAFLKYLGYWSFIRHMACKYIFHSINCLPNVLQSYLHHYVVVYSLFLLFLWPPRQIYTLLKKTNHITRIIKISSTDKDKYPYNEEIIY